MLRPRQTEALSAIKQSYLSGTHRQVVSACTGFGKSVVLSHIPETMAGTLDGQTLILVHRDELIEQNIEKLRKYNPEVRVSKEKAQNFADPDSEIIVASVQTLGRKGLKRLDRFNWDTITKVITDECHHSTSQSYINIYEKSDVLREDTHKLHVGFTATHTRSDGNTLAKIYDKIVFNYPIKKAIDEGWLVRLKGRRIETGNSIDGVSVSGGDFKSKELSDAIDNPERNQLVVKGWLDYGQERQTIGFTAGIKHAKNLAEMFQQHGISAQAVWGDDPSRVDKLSDFKTSKITVLLNCALLTEGIDIWQVGCIMHTSPTQSKVNYTQRIGRGTRLEEGCPNLLSLDSSHVFKKDCIVLDFCDVSSRHSLASLPTLFGLPEKLNLNGKDVVWAVKELEKVQEEFSHLDFTSLKDIDAISLFVQETNLFEVKFPPELEAASQFTWHPSISGGYVLMLPEKESVRIEQNLLDKWQIKAYLKGKRYAGQRDTMEEAFSAADDLVRKIAPEALTVVKREAFWHNNPASKKQLWRLRRLYKGKQIPKDLTSGEASNLIGSALAGKG